MTAYVGIDLHRRRSMVVCLDEGGERLWWRRIENSPQTLREVIAEAGPDPEVVIWGSRPPCPTPRAPDPHQGARSKAPVTHHT